MSDCSKQLDETKAERAESAHAAFEHLPLPALVADDEGVCVLANRAACTQLTSNEGADDLEGRPIADVVESNAPGAFVDLWREMLETGSASGHVDVSNAVQTTAYRCTLESEVAAQRHLITFEPRPEWGKSGGVDRDSRQRAIGELGRFALTDSSIAEITRRAVEIVGPHLAMQMCVYYPPLDHDSFLDPSAVWTSGEEGPEAVRVAADEGLAFRASAGHIGEPTIVEDVDGMEDGLVKEVLLRAGARSAIMVSVGSQGERLGMIVGASSKQVEIGRALREFLESVSRVLGQAIVSKLNLERLEESRSRLQVAMRLGRLSQFEWDVDAGRIDFDEQMARNLGLAPEQMATSVEASFQWVYDKDRDEVIEAVEAVIAGEADEYEVYARIRGLHDEWRWQLSRGRAVERDRDGRATRILGFQQDVHERVKSEIARAELEDQLRQSRKMEALGRLAGGIAHDFNNLLTAIAGYAELVYHELDGSELGADVREILVATERAERLTSRLLSLSRREDLRASVVDVNEIVGDFETMLDRILGEQIEFRTDLVSSIWHVEIDRSAVEQILLNLVVNARDAMPEGGTLSVRTANVELGVEQAERFAELSPGDYVRIEVEDTGVGMDSRTLDRALEPFFTTKDHGEGTGLGLATVYGAARQAGGVMVIDSVEGEGTTAQLLLPRTYQQLSEVELDTPSEVEEACNGETVLVAEDDEVLLNLVVRVLRERGFVVEAFSNPREALDWVEESCEHIDLILTDVVMPDMRGTVLAEHVLEVYPEAHVLFMSGYTADTEFSAWAHDENVGLLRKPFTPSYLLGRVQDVLAR